MPRKHKLEKFFDFFEACHGAIFKHQASHKQQPFRNRSGMADKTTFEDVPTGQGHRHGHKDGSNLCQPLPRHVGDGVPGKPTQQAENLA